MADDRAERIAKLIEPLRVEPGSKVNLAEDFDPRYKAGLKKKDGVGAAADRACRCSPSTRSGWPPRTPTACCSVCRRSTPAARTGRSGT